MTAKRRFYGTLTLCFGGAFAASVAIALVVGSAGIIIAILGAMVAGLGLLVASVQWAQFRKDPMAAIREKYVGWQE